MIVPARPLLRFLGLGLSTALLIAPGQTQQRILAADAFTISGVVTAGAFPAPLVQVFAFSGAAQQSTTTDTQGYYQLTLAAGSYDLVFNPPASLHRAAQVRRSIADTAVINVTLAPGASVTGVVYRDAAKQSPVPNVAIYAFNRDTWAGFGLPPTDAQGHYQIALALGSWDLTFTPPPFQGLGPTQTLALSLTGDMQHDVVLAAGFTLAGRVTHTGAGVANVDLFARDAAQGRGFGFTPSGAGGWYTGTLPLGSYDVLLLAPPFQGLGSTVITDVHGPADQVRDVALPAGVTLSGQLRCGNLVANAFVLATPHPPLSAGSTDGWGRFSGAGGDYALALQTGTYTTTFAPPAGWRFPPPLIAQRTLTANLEVNLSCVFLPIAQQKEELP